jgi:predicted Fe-S protein YdhL (DUF1289 family)
MTPDLPAEPVESPCINVCTLDADSICIGCGRSIDEIARWSRMSSDERRRVREQAVLRCHERLRRQLK